MKAKILFGALSVLLPMAANAAIPYRVEQRRMPVATTPSGLDNEAFARQKRFYVGAMYNFAMWDGYTDDADIHVGGKNSSSFEVVAGLRLYDTFRIEANYLRNRAQWSEFSMTGDTAFINAIFDARIDNIYRLFHTQKIIPYVGLGAGLSWDKAHDVSIDSTVTPAVAALAGVGFELGSWFTVDLGYRYFYGFTPKFDAVHDLNPTAHQFRAGARVNF